MLDRFVPNLPATDYEANLQVISSVKTVQVHSLLDLESNFLIKIRNFGRYTIISMVLINLDSGVLFIS